jgi:hypothetical protein
MQIGQSPISRSNNIHKKILYFFFYMLAFYRKKLYTEVCT